MAAADMSSVSISPMCESDWQAVRAIYQEGIRTGDATFEQSLPEWTEWDARHLSCCRFVAWSKAEIVGWAALSVVSTRRAYAGVAEVSIYVAKKIQGQGIGTKLLHALVEASERNRLWTLQAGIFPENQPSLQLHKAAGFRVVGTREKIGSMNGRWRDVLLLERRSNTVGVP
jgi:L-amino acid N-acyltransferase YncA